MDVVGKRQAIIDAIETSEKQKKWLDCVVAVDAHYKAEREKLSAQLETKTATGYFLTNMGLPLGIDRQAGFSFNYHFLKNDSFFRLVLEVMRDIFFNGFTYKSIARIADVFNVQGKLKVIRRGGFIDFCFFNLTIGERDFIEANIELIKLFKNGLFLTVTAGMETTMIFDKSWGKLSKVVERG